MRHMRWNFLPILENWELDFTDSDLEQILTKMELRPQTYETHALEFSADS